MFASVKLSKQHHDKIIQFTEKDISNIIHHMSSTLFNDSSLNQWLYEASQAFLDRPYKHEGTAGEGNRCDDLSPHCDHLQQDPIIRTDQFDCTTYTTAMLALMNANNWQQFLKNIAQINYNQTTQNIPIIGFLNRNHFISTDFNPSNQATGLLQDSLKNPKWAKLCLKSSAIIDHYSWFNGQLQPKFIRSFNPEKSMLLLKKTRGKLTKNEHKEPYKISYIPKNKLIASCPNQKKLCFLPSKYYFDLPTPSVLEIVRDPKQWLVNHRPISRVIHSEILISHMGLLLKHHFKEGQLIYPEIICPTGEQEHKLKCQVINHFCQKTGGCFRMMFSHATTMYPQQCRITRKNDGYRIATTKEPAAIACNRVITMPLFAYLTRQDQGHFIYMENPSILGLHLEQINPIKMSKRT